MKRNTSVYLKNRALDDPSFVFLVSGLINALFNPPKCHLKESEKWSLT